MGEWKYGSIILDQSTDGGEWSASCPGHVNANERTAQYPLERRLDGTQSRLGGCKKKKNLASARN
jgi:hypothetical protein